MKLKHQKAIEQIITELHESWMNEVEKKELNKIVLKLYGKKFDDDIEAGVRSGHSVESQIEIAKEFLRSQRKQNKNG